MALFPQGGEEYNIYPHSTKTKLDLKKLISEALAPIKAEIGILKEKIENGLQNMQPQNDYGLEMEAAEVKEPDPSSDKITASLNKEFPEADEKQRRKEAKRILLAKRMENMFQKRRGLKQREDAHQLKGSLKLEMTGHGLMKERKGNRRREENSLSTLGAVKKRNELNFEFWNWKRRMKMEL